MFWTLFSYRHWAVSGFFGILIGAPFAFFLSPAVFIVTIPLVAIWSAKRMGDGAYRCKFCASRVHIGGEACPKCGRMQIEEVAVPEAPKVQPKITPATLPKQYGKVADAKPRIEFVTPPSWPAPPAGWTPPAGWEPLPEWGPAPEGWKFWRVIDAAA